MRKDSSQDGEHPTSSTDGYPSLGESDFEDSFLTKVVRSQRLPRMPLTGERLGGKEGRRFHIRGPLGSGGMGQVFRAWDEKLRREVALKLIVPHEELTDSALQEAQVIARLDHENIIRIFDVSDWTSAPGEPRIPFLVMEYLEGESLATLLKRGRLEPWRALEILDAIAAGLAHAHERHIIHRDLKPSNVFVCGRGPVKLLDFGLAYLLAHGSTHSPRLPTAGSPAYMAPEQWRAEPQDERTDIWAAGLVLYEMLTGKRLLRNDDFLTMYARVTSDEPLPSVREHSPELPRKLESFLATALAKSPARRFQTARELREELHKLRAQLAFEIVPGAPEPSRQAERRRVALLSCRFTGLSHLGEQLDPEDLGELETAFQQGCTELVRHHGGSILPSVGSGVLACFGCHQVREDDAERAVLAGLDLVRNLPALLRRKLPSLPKTLAVSVGVRTDEVALRNSGTSWGQGPSVHGEAPGMAAWFASLAGPGEVLIGNRTWKLVRGGFELEPLGPRRFEGLAGSVRVNVYRVLRETLAATRFERALAADGLTPLVGRKREMDRLLTLWEGARQGRGASVLLQGEAGIGKSRLIRELCESVHAEATTLLQVQCWSRFNARAHSLAFELLQGVLPLSPDGTPPRPEELEARLGAQGLSAEQARLIGVLLGVPLPEGSPLHLLTPERRRDRAFDALRSLLLHKARKRPVLLTVEDLHWAHSAHLDFLGSLLTLLEGERFLVVLSARPEFRPPWPRHDWEHTLTLERLPADQASHLVRKVGRGRELREEQIQQLVSRTDGIPLFIEEMTRMVLERAPSSSEPTEGLPHSIPYTLQELLLARLDTLPTGQKTLAQVCAVVGRGFTQSLLEGLVEHGDVPLSRELSGLMDAGLLQEGQEPGAPRYEFRHALLQEAAYQSLPRGMRRQYHLRIAQALAKHSPQLVSARPEVLAHHYTEAGLLEPALHYWTQAGRQASLQSAYQEAVGYLSRALELLRRLPDSDERPRDELQIQVALGIPLVQEQGYRSPEVERTFARVRELFYQVGEALPQLELAYWGIYSYHFARAEYGLAHELAEWLVALGQRQGNLELLAQGYRMMATDFFFWGRLSEALEYFERAMAHSHFDLERHRELAMHHWANPLTTALAHTSIVYSLLGQPELARQRARESQELARRIGHPHTLAYALTYSAVGSQVRREVHLALEWAEQAIAISSERGYWLWRSWSKLIRLWGQAELGSPREHLAELEQSIERWLARGVRAGMPYNCGMLAEFHLRLGQVRQGLTAVRQGLGWVETLGEHSCEAELHRLQGELLRVAGKHGEAKYKFFRAIAVARLQQAGLFELRAMVSLGRLLRDLGMPERARRLLTKLLERLPTDGDSPDFLDARALLEQASGPEHAP